MAKIIVIGTTETLTDAAAHTASAVHLLANDQHEIIAGKITRYSDVVPLLGNEDWQAVEGGFSLAKSGYQNDVPVYSNIGAATYTGGSIVIESTAESVAAFKAELAALPATGVRAYVVLQLEILATEYTAGQDLTTKPITITASAVEGLTVTTKTANTNLQQFIADAWDLTGANFNDDSLPAVILQEVTTATPVRAIGATNWHFHQLASLAAFFSNLPHVTDLEFSGADISSATSLAGLFYNTDSLLTLKITDLTLRDQLNVSGLLACEKDATLAAITSGNISITATNDFDDVFKGRELLADLSKFTFDIAGVSSFYDTFAGCANLTEVRLKNWTAGTLDFSDCEDLTSESLHYIVTNATDANGKILVIDSLAKYTAYVTAYPDDVATITANKITIAY